MRVSAIIPTLNEAEHISRLLDRLQKYGGAQLLEIIIVDAGSEDETVKIAHSKDVKVVRSPQKGRAFQMNYGAREAQGEILYFVHADTLPPKCFMQSIKKAIDEDYALGCFRYQFDSPRKLLRINAFFTRFPMLWCRGGDQSLFIKDEVFNALNGFREDYQIMEDFEFIIRARQAYRFKIIPENMLVSARKYHENSYLRVQIANLVVFNMFRFGYSQEAMLKTYRKLLRQIKN